VFAELENATPNPVADFTGGPFAGNAPLTVNFQDISTGVVSAWFWTFGDGTTSFEQHPSHVYTTPLQYTISLTVFGPGGTDTEIKTGLLVTEPAPVANFSAAPTTGLTPLAVAFTNLSSGGSVSSWSWDFGDGGSSTLSDPNYIYTTDGTYTVTLTATGPGGTSVETKTDLIVTSDEVLSDFTVDRTFGFAPLTVNFSDASTGVVTGWNWNFGDTNGSINQNPQHIYGVPGTYTVTLIVSGGSSSDIELKADYITVIGPTVADFTAGPTSGSAPLAVSFTDTSTSSPTSWSWDFGDGKGSSQQNPSHVYSLPGTYTVALSADGPGGLDVETKADYVVVTPTGESIYYNGTGENPPCFSSPPPILGTIWQGRVDTRVLENSIASLLYVRIDTIPGVSTSFGEALFDPTGFIFDNLVISVDDIHVHQFPIPSDPSYIGRTGVAQALVLTSSGMVGQFCNAAVMIVGTEVGSPSPDAAFSASATDGALPLLVSFTDESTAGATSWQWDFGDGTSSTSQHPTMAYVNEGTYTVTLLVNGGQGFSSEIKEDHIVVYQPVSADFSAGPLTGYAPVTVDFTDLSIGTNVHAWSWDFGDGGSSTEQSPSHTYTVPGTYTVSLTATGTSGPDTETKSDYVVIESWVPITDFSATPLNGLAPLAVAFTDETIGTATSWSWNFGDGTISSSQNPTHTYLSAGTYTVSLTASNSAASDTNTKVDYITALPVAPAADFSAAPTVGTYPLSVHFTDLTVGVVTSWSWGFGDGSSSTEQNPTHTYTAAGTYTVALEATGPGGPDTHTKFGYVQVNPPAPAADFTGSPTSGAAPLSVAFSDASSGAITSWAWSFGDGEVSSLASPTHVFVLPGTYTVSLAVSGPGGADLESKAGYVVASAPSIQDGSFELQAAGQAPTTPWSTLGSALVQPDGGTLADNGMPAAGAKWGEISGAGTSGAIPPSNPGGAGSAPSGTNGLQQSFGFDPTQPVLAFSASFLLGDEAASLLNNDFMSVDITDGSTTHNLFYADTFSAFPNTSARYGLPMSDVRQVGANLDVLFPAATATTLLTLTVSVGNGGDGLDPSIGFVDDFFMLGVASGAYRNGHGTNPPCYVAEPPIVGTTWLAHVDHRDRPDVGFVFVLLRSMATSQQTVYGQLLVGGATLDNFTAVASGTGMSTIPFALPADLSLMGVGTSQAFLVSLSHPAQQTFCNAIDFMIGFEPPAPRTDAEFSASAVSGAAPLSVSFSDTSSSIVTSWAWDFGDGSTAATQNPTHTYSAPGTYTVWLRATGPGGFDIERKFDHIQVQ